jgi:hypothetical protein
MCLAAQAKRRYKMAGKRVIYKEDGLKRKNRFSFLLNSREMRAIEIYCERYRIKNKSEFMRETIMKAIIKRFDEEYPSLWGENELTLFNKKTAR